MGFIKGVFLRNICNKKDQDGMILLFNVAVVEGGAGEVLCNLVALQHLSKAKR